MNQSSADSLLIALGAGLEKKTSQDPPYLWIGNETELRAAAAAKLWQQNKNAWLIFSGGRPGGPGTPSEAETMQDYVQRPPWNVPPERILTENESIDTASNIRNVAAIITQRGLPTGNVILIAGKSNIARAAAYCRAYCIYVTPKLARVVLGSDIQRLGLPTVSDAMSMATYFHEFLMRVEQLVDRKGVLVTRFKQWQLNRQHRQS